MAVFVAIENIKMIRNQRLRQYTIYTVQDRIIENCFKSIKNESFLSLKINLNFHFRSEDQESIGRDESS